MSSWSHYGLKVRRGCFRMSQRIFITGGLGYIGGRLASHLLQRGYQVVIGTRSDEKNTSWLPKIKLIKIDWSNILDIENSIKGNDVIVHATGLNAKECDEDPIAAFAINELATGRLAEAAVNKGIKQLIYLSTAHVYSNPLVGVISEETKPSNISPYALSHLFGENAILSACKNKLISSTVLRLSNVFGSPMEKNVNCWMLLVNDLCKQSVQTKKIKLRSSGLQMRNFLCMTDLCEIVEYIIKNKNTDLKNNIINVGSKESVTVRSMAQFIQQRCIEVLGYQPQLDYEINKNIEDNKILKYEIKKIIAFGNDLLKENKIKEIDNLLKFCYSNFKV